MGGRAGGGAAGGLGSRLRGEISARQQLANKYLSAFNNQTLKKELTDAIYDFDKEFGMPDYTIISADLGKKYDGKMSPETKRIGIHSKYDDGKMSAKDAKHTMIHELAHTMDLGHSNTTSARKDFNKKLTSLYKSFKSDYVRKNLHIGSYALTNKHEFFAEAIAYHMTGRKDEYTTKVFKLAKSMIGK